MGALGLWLMTGVLIFSAVVAARVAYTNRSRSFITDRLRRALAEERTVQQACADLDDEYRELTRR